jgi:hypothetical protein
MTNWAVDAAKTTTVSKSPQALAAILLSGAALLLSLVLIGCQHPRPQNVPIDSVYVNGANGDGWWQHCSYDATREVDYCQIYNWGGGIIWNEVSLPYDGGAAAKQSELLIDSKNRLAGPQYVCLKNGRILIPKSEFENQKRFLDFMTGKSKTL